MVNKRAIEKALLRALNDQNDLEEVESELLLTGGNLKRLKKKKKKPEVPFIEKDVVQ